MNLRIRPALARHPPPAGCGAVAMDERPDRAVLANAQGCLETLQHPDEAELQATLAILKHYYNHHRPHQSLNRLTPDQAVEILKLRAKKPPRKR